MDKEDVKTLINKSFIFVDKPINLSSHEVSSYISKLFNVKAGHAGTLDPNVSGLLIIGLGKATKMLRFLAEQPKEYVCLMKLKNDMKEEEVKKLLLSFQKEVLQMPPEKSAVAKKLRKRKVYNVKFIEKQQKLVLFNTLVEKGTYMRVLCQQMNGEMVDLRRVSYAGISEEKGVTMQKIFRAMYKYNNGDNKEILEILHTTDETFYMSNLQKIFIKETAVRNIMNGSPLYKAGVIEEKTGKLEKGYACAFCGKNLVAIMKVVNDNKKNIVATIERLNV